MQGQSLIAVSFIALAFIVGSVTPVIGDIPPPSVEYFSSVIDHFSQPPPGKAAATFQQKILICDKFWKNTQPNVGPVLVYIGNEGPIEGFYDNTGIIFEWAEQLGALIVFMEHRYYGSSLPFGNSSFIPANLRYLTIQQALEDYAVIIRSLQQSFNIAGPNAVPWIAVGGSYGGVLSAWMRFRYPQLIQGAIAASAPIKYLSPNVDYSYFAATSQDYQQQPNCAETIEQGYAELQEMVTNGEFNQIQQLWRLCDMPTKETIEHVILWSVNSLLSLAQYDYPYPTNFEAPLDAYPVTQACQLMAKIESPIEALGKAVGLFYNGTGGSLPCYDTKSEFIECADYTGCGLGDDGTAWDYQVCTQFVYLPNTNGKSDIFPPHKFDFDDLKSYCFGKYGVTPDPFVLNLDFAGSEILTQSSNIVFSNGDIPTTHSDQPAFCDSIPRCALDPFHAGGFLPSKSHSSAKKLVVEERIGSNGSNSIILILIADGAHHLDLRATNPLDPQSVTQARQVEIENINKWIAQFQPPSQ